MRVLSIVLWPFSVVFGCIASFRYFLYRTGILKRTAFAVPVIVVGNLKVGGTGKTPHTEYITRKLLSAGEKWGLLSRGYGRTGKGFRWVGKDDSPILTGDEPLMLYQKLHAYGAVSAVCESRPEGIQKMLSQYPNLSGLVLDDAFQHFPLKASCYILLTEYGDLFVNDLPLPAGRLRERRKAAARANCIIVTKCSADIAADTMANIEQQIARYAPGVPVCFSRYEYLAPVPVNTGEGTLAEYASVVLFSGIAGGEKFHKAVAERYNVKKFIAYPDHHAYTATDWQFLCHEAAILDCELLTTEKDAVKLTQFAGVGDVPLYALPIGVYWVKGEEKLWQVIENCRN